MNWRRGIFVLAGAVLAVAAFGLLLSPAPDPTPIRDFSAPFVFGHFRVPEENALTEEGPSLVVIPIDCRATT